MPSLSAIQLDSKPQFARSRRWSRERKSPRGRAVLSELVRFKVLPKLKSRLSPYQVHTCLLYTSDAADDWLVV